MAGGGETMGEGRALEGLHVRTQLRSRQGDADGCDVVVEVCFFDDERWSWDHVRIVVRR